MYVPFTQSFAVLECSSFLPHVRVDTEKHSFQEDLCDNHKKPKFTIKKKLLID